MEDKATEMLVIKISVKLLLYTITIYNIACWITVLLAYQHADGQILFIHLFLTTKVVFVWRTDPANNFWLPE